MTFSLTIQTAKDRAAEALSARLTAAAAECRRRIEAVADPVAQLNMASASAAGLMTDEHLAVYRSWLAWVAATRGSWRSLAEDDADLSDDANWPPVPAGVVELASRF